MAFIRVKNITGAETAFERYLPADDLDVLEGQCLVHGAGGKLAVSGPTVKPEFISISSVEARTPQEEKVTVIRASDSEEYEVRTALTVPVTALGELRTLSAEGLDITATTTDGVFLISSTDGNTPSIIRGYFR